MLRQRRRNAFSGLSPIIYDDWMHRHVGLFRRGLKPATRALYGALPPVIRLQPLLLRRARVKPGVARRVDLLERLGARDVPAKQADSGPSEQCRAERGALTHFGPDDLEPANVRKYLHREVPVRHPAVHLEVRELRMCVERHALDYRARLERVRLERRTRYVRRGRVRREPDQQPRRGGVPVRREQARERRDEVDPGRRGHGARERVDLVG